MMKSLVASRPGRRSLVPSSRDLLGGLMDRLPGRRKARDSKSLLPLDPLPALDVSEDGKEVLVTLEAPGFSDKDLEITYAEGVLHIRGEKTVEREEKRRGTHYRESRHGSFRRSVPIGTGVDWEKAQARFKRGKLRIAIPKRAGPSDRKLIPVS